MIETKHKVSIEEFDGKNYRINLVEPEDKAVITHYLHNVDNGVSKHYKKDALKVLKNFEYKGDGVWEDGKIYDPENGKTYSCKMTLRDSEHLDVRGFIGFSLLGRTENWTRTVK